MTHFPTVVSMLNGRVQPSNLTVIVYHVVYRGKSHIFLQELVFSLQIVCLVLSLESHSSGFAGVQKVHSSLKVSDPVKVQNAAHFLVSALSSEAYRLIDSHCSKRWLHESESSFLELNISIWLVDAILITRCHDLAIV